LTVEKIDRFAENAGDCVLLVHTRDSHEKREVTLNKPAKQARSNIAERKQIEDLFAELSDSTVLDQHANSLVQDITGLWRNTCRKDDAFVDSLINSVKCMQKEIETTGYELRDEVALFHPPSSKPLHRQQSDDSLLERALLSEDLAEMLAIKEADLTEALAQAEVLQAQIEVLQSQLEDAQLQLSITARFSGSITPELGIIPSRDSGSITTSQSRSQDDTAVLQKRVDELEFELKQVCTLSFSITIPSGGIHSYIFFGMPVSVSLSSDIDVETLT
jgi:multidrug efflux pump subunit AcrA (membrane-fusion protein)